MGSDDHYPEEAPAHKVTVEGFWIDRHTVTNAEFARFVARTGHVTVAERAPDPADYPGARPELLVAASTVFRQPPPPGRPGQPLQLVDLGARGRLAPPPGPGQLDRKKPDHPVVHVAWDDVQAYARWAGKELPDRGRVGAGGPRRAGGRRVRLGRRADARAAAGWPTPGRASSRTRTRAGRLRGDGAGRPFPPNGYGLLDMIGNVWEWTSDWYQAHGELPQRLLRGGQPARRRARPERRPRRPGPDPAQGHEGRVAPVRPQLLPPLPPGRPHAPGVDTGTSPPRFPLHRLHVISKPRTDPSGPSALEGMSDLEPR